MDSDYQTGIAPYAPRHMRKRRLSREIIDTIPGWPQTGSFPARPRREFSARSKRFVAMMLVSIVSGSIPLLLIAILVARS